MYKYKAIKERTSPIESAWWVVAEGEGSEELKVAEIPHWIKHPKTVAEAIAYSLNYVHKDYELTDLI